MKMFTELLHQVYHNNTPMGEPKAAWSQSDSTTCFIILNNSSLHSASGAQKGKVVINGTKLFIKTLFKKE